jgi:hypothetical protein
MFFLSHHRLFPQAAVAVVQSKQKGGLLSRKSCFPPGQYTVRSGLVLSLTPRLSVALSRDDSVSKCVCVCVSCVFLLANTQCVVAAVSFFFALPVALPYCNLCACSASLPTA